MRTRVVVECANSVRISAGPSAADNGVWIRFEESGHSMSVGLTRQKAGALKDALNKMDLLS